MAKREVKTDLWVYDLLKQANIHLDPQGSSIKEIDTALKTASKKGTGKVGFPEYVGVVKDYLLVIEDKADLAKHIKLSVLKQQRLPTMLLMAQSFMENILRKTHRIKRS